MGSGGRHRSNRTASRKRKKHRATSGKGSRARKDRKRRRLAQTSESDAHRLSSAEPKSPESKGSSLCKASVASLSASPCSLASHRSPASFSPGLPEEPEALEICEEDDVQIVQAKPTQNRNVSRPNQDPSAPKSQFARFETEL
ncbi:unnamed protein product [Durusdinium trenchii]|uniref:Uncharacterized protein n=1 Tax=Durusdinium trenchii TaxID=1381693 RepID=A0ABP0LLT9_9DINO